MGIGYILIEDGSEEALDLLSKLRKTNTPLRVIRQQTELRDSAELFGPTGSYYGKDQIEWFIENLATPKEPQ